MHLLSHPAFLGFPLVTSSSGAPEKARSPASAATLLQQYPWCLCSHALLCHLQIDAQGQEALLRIGRAQQPAKIDSLVPGWLITNVTMKRSFCGVREIGQMVKTPNAKPDNLNSILVTHMIEGEN